MSLTLLLLFAISFVSFMQKEKKEVAVYAYIDGNNNVFEIFQTRLVYNPISPERSSSGEYSGGNPAQTALNSEQFENIEAKIKAVIKDKSHHLDSRPMGCGTIVIKSKSLFVDASSSLLKELDTLLRSLVGN